MCILVPTLARAQATTVTATWDPRPASEQVSSYEVCVGTSSMSCNVRVATVNASETSYELAPTPGQLTYLAVRSINSSGRSGYSTESRFSIPAFNTLTNRSTQIGVALTPFAISVSDPDGSPLTFSHTGLPLGLTLNGTTGQITGIPTGVGTFNVTIFVSDGLATVSRSFVWTVTASSASADTLAPVLTITSHTSGQVVTTASQTIRGTATDNERGGSGITVVRVNGQPASGGTATGRNVANWSRTIDLVTGSNTITVEAVDGAGNIQMQQITLSLAASGSSSTTSPLAITGLTSNLASPQAAGTPITFSAGASGGVAPLQFKFFVQPAGGTAQVARNWSTEATYAWTAPETPGTYTITVWARKAGVTANAAQASAAVTYSILAAGVSAVSVSPSSGAGSTQTFALKYSDTRGAANMISEWVWFTGGTGTCMAYHERATNQVYLLNDAGTAWTSQVLGSNTALQNTSCSIAVGSSSVSVSGPALTLSLVVAFKQAFNGDKTVKMFLSSAGGLSSGWQDRGVWTVPTSVPTAPSSTPAPTPAPPSQPSVPPGVSALDVSPASGSGSSKTFTLRFSDSRGASSLISEWVWFAGGTGTSMCMAYHERATNLVYLVNDAGTAWSSQALGSGGVLKNSSCTINLGASSVSASGSIMTLNLAVTFKPAFAGPKTTRIFANAAGGLSSGWQDRGTWTVTTSAAEN